jgi:hypothetical protein
MDIQHPDAGGRATIIPFPESRQAKHTPVSERERDRALAHLMLKRLDFERRIRNGALSGVEIATEGMNLTTELFIAASDLGL